MNILFLCTLVLEQVLSAFFCYAVIAFGSILKKNVLRADIEVNTDGYYEFNNAISFAPGAFAVVGIIMSFNSVFIDIKALKSA